MDGLIFHSFPQLDSQYTATAKVRHDQIRNEVVISTGEWQSAENCLVRRVWLEEGPILCQRKEQLVRLGQGPALSEAAL